MQENQASMKNQLNKYPSLSKSYKGKFPFKLGTTSFIYPDHYIPNVKMLGPYLDEIELLLFESRGTDALPSRRVIAELCRLAREFNLSYNVHLPTDVSISDRDPMRRRQAVATMIRVMDMVRPLNASALVLHAPFDEKSYDRSTVAKWQETVCHSLDQIKPEIDAQDIIALETLDYPPELLDDIVSDFDLTICLDLGHLMVYDYDQIKAFNQYGFITSVIHLHGVENGRDHLSMDRLSDQSASSVLQILKRFTGVVSLEVFSFDDLFSSLRFFDRHFAQCSPGVVNGCSI